MEIVQRLPWRALYGMFRIQIDGPGTTGYQETEPAVGCSPAGPAGLVVEQNSPGNARPFHHFAEPTSYIRRKVFCEDAKPRQAPWKHRRPCGKALSSPASRPPSSPSHDRHAFRITAIWVVNPYHAPVLNTAHCCACAGRPSLNHRRSSGASAHPGRDAALTHPEAAFAACRCSRAAAAAAAGRRLPWCAGAEQAPSFLNRRRRLDITDGPRFREPLDVFARSRFFVVRSPFQNSAHPCCGRASPAVVLCLPLQGGTPPFGYRPCFSVMLVPCMLPLPCQIFLRTQFFLTHCTMAAPGLSSPPSSTCQHC